MLAAAAGAPSLIEPALAWLTFAHDLERLGDRVINICERVAYIVTGEQFRGGLYDPFGDWPRKLNDLALLAVRQLGPLAGLVLAGFLLTAIRHRTFALLTGSALVITCFFNAAYENAEIQRYYLGPALIAWVWLAILP